MAAWTGNEGERTGNRCVLEAEPVEHAGEEVGGGEIRLRHQLGNLTTGWVVVHLLRWTRRREKQVWDETSKKCVWP